MKIPHTYTWLEIGIGKTHSLSLHCPSLSLFSLYIDFVPRTGHLNYNLRTQVEREREKQICVSVSLHYFKKQIYIISIVCIYPGPLF